MTDDRRRENGNWRKEIGDNLPAEGREDKIK